MFAEELSKYIVEQLSGIALSALLPVMFLAFLLGITLRALLYYTVKTENKFSTEFEKRTQKFLLKPKNERDPSFYKTVKTILEHTYLETFELKHRYRRRNLDHISTLADRFFLIEAATNRLLKDTLKQIRYLKKDGPQPRMNDFAKGVFDRNPVFNKLLGIFPVSLVNDFLNLLPGLFVIGGIFGTFLGISKGLPELGHMNLSDMVATKTVMDTFLIKIAYSMAASIMGIFLSVVMNLINTGFSADGLYFDTVNRYTNALEFIWNETSNNDWDRNEAETEETTSRESQDTKGSRREMDDGNPEEHRSRRNAA